MHISKSTEMVKKITTALIALFCCSSLSFSEDLVGWATVDGTTTGGDGGIVVTVTTGKELQAAINKEITQVIKVQGKLTDLNRISISGISNITIEGAAQGAELVTTFYIEESSNIIIRNLIVNAVSGGQMDIFSIEESCHHIWIDHCDISDNRSTLDGLVDMTHGCDNITISWNKFHYPDSTIAHRFAMLISHSDDAGSEDSGKERITIHHNWWADNIEERMPRARFGQIHVFNNYYNSIGNNYCIGPGVDAKVVAESNYFDNVNNPHIFFDSVTSAQIRINDDNFYALNVTGRKDVGQGDAFVIPYAYTLDAGANVKSIVMEGAGPFGKPVHVFGNSQRPVSRANYYASSTSTGKAFTIQGAQINSNAKHSVQPIVVKKQIANMQIQMK